MNVNLEKFIKRNQKRNSKLYLPECVEGVDYVTCPVSKQRLSMIKKSYIERVLGMTVAEYDQQYPSARKISQRRKNNIKMGLKEIDVDSGLTKYELGQQKARETLKSTDENGMSGYKKKGQKTRATHLSKIDESGRNGYRRQADFRLTTILSNGLTVEQNAHLKQKESLIRNHKTGSGGASKQSKKVLAPILDLLNNNNVKYYFDKNEYGIKDLESGNYYFWDLTIPLFQLVIEYQSSAWHADPCLLDEEWNRWTPPRGKTRTANDILLYDYNKARALYKNRGFVTYYVWQKTEETDVKELLCLLKTMIMKS